MFDVSKVVPQAQPIVEAAATVYLKHTSPWFVGLIAHGSAVKGGFIPGCSDIDLQLYLDGTTFTASQQLPIELAIAIQRDLSKIDPAPFQYIQCYAFSSRLPENYVGPIPGAYAIISGSLPVPVTTPDQLQQAAIQALTQLDPVPPFVTQGLLEHGGERFGLHIRWLCTNVWPNLYHMLVQHQYDPIYIWNLPKEKAIALLPQDTMVGQTIRAFYQAVQTYYGHGKIVEDGLSVIENGIAFLQAAKLWWNEQ